MTRTVCVTAILMMSVGIVPASGVGPSWDLDTATNTQLPDFAELPGDGSASCRPIGPGGRLGRSSSTGMESFDSTTSTLHPTRRVR